MVGLNKVNTRPGERRVVNMTTQVKRLEIVTEHQKSQITVINTGLKKIYKIWDCFFRTFGTLVSLGLAFLTLAKTRKLYYLNGKWSFGTILLGVMIFCIVFFGLQWLTWYLFNKFLINKIKIECVE